MTKPADKQDNNIIVRNSYIIIFSNNHSSIIHFNTFGYKIDNIDHHKQKIILCSNTVNSFPIIIKLSIDFQDKKI